MEGATAIQLAIGINPLWPGEKLPQGDPRWGQYTHSFRKEQHTIESLIKRVAGDGCSFSPVMRNSHREIENFISAQHIGLDDDRGTHESSLEALADDPFIAAHAAFLYETPSSTPEEPKSRILFILDQPFDDAEEYRTAQEALWWKYGATDSQVKEPARFFYGRLNASHITLGNVLYRDVLQEQVIEPYLQEGRTGVNGHRAAEPIGETIPVKKRNSTLTSLVGSLHRREIPQAVIRSTVTRVNAELCEVPLPEEEIDTIVKSICSRPSGARGQSNGKSSLETPAHQLRFRSAAEIARETPEETEWLCRPWLASESITEVDGKVKVAGKTTWVMAMCRKILDGQQFMGGPTMRTPIVYLTEQPQTGYRQALRRADLLEREDFYILHYQDTFRVPWEEVVQAATRKCIEVRSKLLVVDTLPQFAGIRGDSENSSGAALETLQPIQAVVAYGVSVVVIRHDGKADRQVGDSGRGSSAWGGVSDIFISIRRGKGNSLPTVRVLHCIGRFDETPDRLVINLDPDCGEYSIVGTETQVALIRAKAAILKVAPESQEEAEKTNDLIDRAEGVKTTVGKEAIRELVEQRELEVTGTGKRNDAKRYWKPEKSEPQ